MRSRVAIIRVKDNEVDYLLTNLALRVSIPFGYATKALAIRGPFEENMMPNKLLTCGVEECEHGVGWWYGYRLEARRRRMREKSSLLSDNAASSSSEDMSATAGCKDVMCVRRAYVNSQHREMASCIHLRRSFCSIWGGRFPRTSRVVSPAEKVVREGRSSSRVSRWNLTVKLSSTTFVVGH